MSKLGKLQMGVLLKQSVVGQKETCWQNELAFCRDGNCSYDVCVCFITNIIMKRVFNDHYVLLLRRLL